MAMHESEVRTIGVIGGSGLYEMDGLTDIQEVALTTPFGAPSDAYISGLLRDLGVRLIFLPRHGRGHRILPHEINYRANIHGFKQLGVEHLISVSAVGSLREHIHPGHIVLPDQFIDRTKARASTFFGDGAAAHVQFGDPVCPVLHDTLVAAAQAESAGREGKSDVHDRGTYVVMEGPAFSTRAESFMYRAWGADVVGMTNLPEAKLAREAELCYASIALSTDYDCWHQDEEAVTVEAVVAVIHSNIKKARAIVRDAASRIAGQPARSCACQSAAKGALMTRPELVPPATRERLALILGKYLG